RVRVDLVTPTEEMWRRVIGRAAVDSRIRLLLRVVVLRARGLIGEALGFFGSGTLGITTWHASRLLRIRSDCANCSCRPQSREALRVRPRAPGCGSRCRRGGTLWIARSER